MDNNERLFEAVKDNNVSEVISLVSDDMSLVYAEEQGFTALYYAAQLGHSEVCNILLLYGADINWTSTGYNQTPLHIAAVRGHVNSVDILIQHQANAHA